MKNWKFYTNINYINILCQNIQNIIVIFIFINFNNQNFLYIILLNSFFNYFSVVINNDKKNLKYFLFELKLDKTFRCLLKMF